MSIALKLIHSHNINNTINYSLEDYKNELTQLDRDILFALIDHFKYSVKDIDSYSELTDEEKDIISQDTWNKIVLK